MNQKDENRTIPRPENMLEGVLVQIFAKAFAGEGSYDDLAQRKEYFEIFSGVIDAGPPWAYAGMDARYSSIVDLKSQPRVAPELGGDEARRRWLDAMKAKGIKVIEDLVVNHIYSGSPAAQGRQGKKFLRLIENPGPEWQQQMNLFGGAPLIPVPQFGENTYVRCTFYPDQWDVDWQKPDVQRYYSRVAKRLQADGIEIARLDAFGHVGGGPNIETPDGRLTPTSFMAANILRDAAPGLGLMAEVTGDRTFVNQYLCMGLHAYDLGYAGYALLGVAREHFGELRAYLRIPVESVNGSRLLITMGVHDDVNTSLAGEENHRELSNTVGRNGRFEIWGRALNQRLSMLTPTYEADRMLLGLMLSLPGVTPVLYQGDAEYRQGNVNAAERDPRRDKMLWEPLQDNILPPGYAPDALLPGVSVAEQLVDRWSPLNNTRRYITLHNTSRAIQQGEYVELNTFDNDAPLAFAAITGEPKEDIVAVANPSRFRAWITLDLSMWGGHEIEQLVTNGGYLPGEPLQWEEMPSVPVGGQYRLLLPAHGLVHLRVRR